MPLPALAMQLNPCDPCSSSKQEQSTVHTAGAVDVVNPQFPILKQLIFGSVAELSLELVWQMLAVDPSHKLVLASASVAKSWHNCSVNFDSISAALTPKSSRRDAYEDCASCDQLRRMQAWWLAIGRFGIREQRNTYLSAELHRWRSIPSSSWSGVTIWIVLDQQQLQWRLHTLRVLFSSDDLPGLLVAIGGTRVLSALELTWCSSSMWLLLPECPSIKY